MTAARTPGDQETLHHLHLVRPSVQKQQTTITLNDDFYLQPHPQTVQYWQTCFLIISKLQDFNLKNLPTIFYIANQEIINFVIFSTQKNRLITFY